MINPIELIKTIKKWGGPLADEMSERELVTLFTAGLLVELIAMKLEGHGETK